MVSFMGLYYFAGAAPPSLMSIVYVDIVGVASLGVATVLKSVSATVR